MRGQPGYGARHVRGKATSPKSGLLKERHHFFIRVARLRLNVKYLKKLKDYEKHIACTIKGMEHQSFCGASIHFDFHFQGLNHAFNTIFTNGRFSPCKKCLKAAWEVFKEKKL